MELRVAGVTFATLFATIFQHKGDVEGFLLGSIVHKTEHVLEDANHNVRGPSTASRTTQHYVLRHFLVTGSTGSFYDHSGTINVERLRQWVRKGEQDGLSVIGWFRTRGHSAPRLTLRESMVWRGMLQLGPRHGHKEYFRVDPLCALITMSPQNNTTALTFEYRFMDPSVGVLEPTICNLGSSSAAEYRELAVTWAHAGGALPPACAPHVGPSAAIAGLEDAHRAALIQLAGLAQRAQDAQQQIADLDAEIAELQRTMRMSMEDAMVD